MRLRCRSGNRIGLFYVRIIDMELHTWSPTIRSWSFDVRELFAEG